MPIDATMRLYHPNYISGYIRRETGKPFPEIVPEQRMERAAALLKGAGLSVENVAAMLGHSNNSNFYKAFRAYYHTNPREFIASRKAAGSKRWELAFAIGVFTIICGQKDGQVPYRKGPARPLYVLLLAAFDQAS